MRTFAQDAPDSGRRIGASRSPLIERYLPIYDFRSPSSLFVNAPTLCAYREAHARDPEHSSFRSLILSIGGAFGRNSMRAPGGASGLLLLGEREGEEFALGAVGKFWSPSNRFIKIAPDEFVEFRRRGYSKAAFNFRVQALTTSSVHVTLETRVRCEDPSARWAYSLHWLFFGLFGALMRREWLLRVKRRAETH